MQLPDDIHPELAARLLQGQEGGLFARMGIEVVSLSAEHSVARMPVAGNTQTVGILHGGAHVVLGETLGSLSAAIHGGHTRFPVGLDINATHTRAIDRGWVIGTCRAISLGGRICVHEIVNTDEDGNRLSTIRMTNYLREAR